MRSACSIFIAISPLKVKSKIKFFVINCIKEIFFSIEKKTVISTQSEH